MLLVCSCVPTLCACTLMCKEGQHCVATLQVSCYEPRLGRYHLARHASVVLYHLHQSRVTEIRNRTPRAVTRHRATHLLVYRPDLCPCSLAGRWQLPPRVCRVANSKTRARRYQRKYIHESGEQQRLPVCMSSKVFGGRVFFRPACITRYGSSLLASRPAAMRSLVVRPLARLAITARLSAPASKSRCGP